MRGEVIYLFLLLCSVRAGITIIPARTEHNNNKNDKLLHLSYNFSLFLAVSLLFKCRFVA